MIYLGTNTQDKSLQYCRYVCMYVITVQYYLVCQICTRNYKQLQKKLIY